MEALRLPKPKKFSAAVEAQHARYERRVREAEEKTDLMLRAIHAASRPAGTPYVESEALHIISLHLQADRSLTFHESIAIQYYWATHDNAPFYW